MTQSSFAFFIRVIVLQFHILLQCNSLLFVNRRVGVAKRQRVIAVRFGWVIERSVENGQSLMMLDHFYPPIFEKLSVNAIKKERTTMQPSRITVGAQLLLGARRFKRFIDETYPTLFTTICTGSCSL